MNEVEIKNVSINIKLTDRKAIKALAMAAQCNATALEANAEAIKAIAEMGRHHGPSYGIYIAREGSEA